MEPMNFSPISSGNSPSGSGSPVIWPPPAPAYLPPFLAGELSSVSPSKSFGPAGRLFDSKGHHSNSMHMGGKSKGRHVGFEDIRNLDQEVSKGPPKFGFGSYGSPTEIPTTTPQCPPPGMFETPKRPADSFNFQPSGDGDLRRIESSKTSNWVTVFGFPSNATSFILSHFSTYGTIVETKDFPGCNWIALRYESKMEARRALGRNGTILGNSLMIGVVVTSPTSQEFDGFGSENIPSTSFQSPGSFSAGPPAFTSSVSKADEIKAKLRPLNSSTIGMGGLSDRHVAMVNVPRENNSLLTKAFEMFFGY